MSHNQERSSWQRESILSLLSGIIYGGTNTLVGHPLDTIKTKMQAQENILHQKQSLIKIIQSVIKNEGYLALYKGCIPPFIGSILYRSLQFSIFELFFTKWNNHPILSLQIQNTMGLEYRTIIAGILASISRAVVECPFEYAKIRLQTQQRWQLNQIYLGFWPLLMRTTGMMTTYFVIIDSLRRNTNLYSSLLGQFLASGGASVVAWAIIWPLETLKTQVQAQTQNVGNSLSSRMLYVYQLHGFQGFFRGFSAGAQSIFYRNGAAMIAMQKTQAYFTQKGYRNNKQ